MKVVNPDIRLSKPYKDFGQGFYLSKDRQQAYELAMTKVNQMKFGDAFVNVFFFDDKYLSSGELKVLIFDDYSEDWANFVLMNRNEKIKQPSHDYDIVYGPIADDGVNYQLRRYRGGVISLQKMIEELKYAKGITFQYFFGSELAISKLKPI